MAGKRIVLLEMPTEDAEEFVRAVVAAGEGGGPVFVRDYEMTVEAVVARPTSACRCTQVSESKYQRRKRLRTQATKDQAWRRGPKFGWWLCSSCRKPSRAAVLHWVSSMIVGANDLLPEILGIGPAIPASLRWQRDGGVINTHADDNHFTPGRVKALGGELTRVRRKPRRSELARQASRHTSGGTNDE